jgi:hypothetical protein
MPSNGTTSCFSSGEALFPDSQIAIKIF